MARLYIGRGLIMAVLIIALLELGAHLFFKHNMSGRFDYGYHPTAGIIDHGDTIELVRAGGRRFRPQTFSKKPAPGSERIFCIGDSVPRGPGLEEAYAHQLEEILVEAGIPADSVNMGIPGFGSRRKQLVLKATMTYQPTLVIYHLNDSNEYEDEREFRRSQEFKSWHPKNWAMKPFILRRLYELRMEKMYWKWLPHEVRLINSVQDAAAETKASESPETLALWKKRVGKITREDIQSIRGSGARVLLVVQCRFEPDANDVRHLIRNDFLEDLARSLSGPGVEMLSMYDVFKERDPSEYFSDSAHMRSKGHRLLAELIYQKCYPAREP
jgi:hypothetical protein